MVKAIRIHQTGGPEVLRYEDVDLPAPGPGEAQIRQHAVGVNFIDVYYRTGLYPTPTPFTPGNEGAGEVLAVGPGVEGFKPGDRVAYAGTLGAYAQARNIDAKFLAHLPAEISYETGAAMMLKGLTAEYLLFRSYKVQSGDAILVHAAAGGVGLILCQWAKKLGAFVIGTVGSADKAKLAREAGADATILYRDEDFSARVREITGGQLCHAVYDGVGKDTFPGSLDCLRPFGTFVSFGNASGPVPPFNLGLLSPKALFVTRPSLFAFIADAARLREMAARLFEAVASGAVKIPVHATRPLAEAAEVHRALEGRATTGATVMIP
ncbi:quinone oxidoreductase [Rhodoblastus sphagnicola]|uniref:Quinone oxidoreductase n=1 Tax=Rhodoblastus sphagnicola TaxID=333368 RepID=A0A2S6N6P8_9HYPH|nr:quinone oxidoreductase [Rhodoblastus sphagnicola]MBB4197604.1 NADPH2:quinone reductase [Rhodoblastus sphagnicola]PPQ30284.1 quinone oxidoreductase [Rhodoblastus sphagnicola]